MSKIISVHSFRSGTGKSSIAANVAALLAVDGARVCVVDMDIVSPGISVLFNAEADLSPTLNEYLWGKYPIEKTAHDVSDKIGVPVKGKIYLIPSSSNPRDVRRILSESYDVGLCNDGFREALEKLELDYLVADTHPGLNEETLLTIAISDTVIVVMRPDAQDYQGTLTTVDVAKKLDVPQLLIAINEVPKQMMKDGGHAFSRQVEQKYGTAVGAVVPHSEQVMGLIGRGLFSILYSEEPASKAMRGLAELLK